MNNENKSQRCNCKDIEQKLISVLKDNENLVQMIRELRKERQSLKDELERPRAADTGSRPGKTGADDNNSAVQSLIDINHGWKRDYEELQMRYEMLSGEKKLLEDEEKELKERVRELERRQRPLESEIARLATALYSLNQGEARSNDEQCDILKTQISVYKEDFERERRDREKIHEEKEKLKQELEGAEEIIKKLTTELDACKARNTETERIQVRAEDGYLRGRAGIQPRPQVQLVLPYSPLVPMSEERWRMEQHRRGILPRNPPPSSLFYGGEVEVDQRDSYLRA